MNFLEQLAAEWYEYAGYFVRSNVRARKLPGGGWGAELDVLAFSPGKDELIHLELSGDARSWAERKKEFVEKKFILEDAEYSEILGVSVNRIRRIAVVDLSRQPRTTHDWGRVEVCTIPQFMETIFADLRKRHPLNDAVPEGFPILRGVQFTLAFATESPNGLRLP
jgi:hypothetical protein